MSQQGMVYFKPYGVRQAMWCYTWKFIKICRFSKKHWLFSSCGSYEFKQYIVLFISIFTKYATLDIFPQEVLPPAMSGLQLSIFDWKIRVSILPEVSKPCFQMPNAYSIFSWLLHFVSWCPTLISQKTSSEKYFQGCVLHKVSFNGSAGTFIWRSANYSDMEMSSAVIELCKAVIRIVNSVRATLELTLDCFSGDTIAEIALKMSLNIAHGLNCKMESDGRKHYMQFEQIPKPTKVWVCACGLYVVVIVRLFNNN